MDDKAQEVQFENLKPIEGLQGPRDLRTEFYRQYVFGGGKGIYTIFQPVALYVSASGGHRVVDSDGKVHYVKFSDPSTVLVWKSRDSGNPVGF